MITKDILIKGGTVVDPSQKINDIRDILIRDGVVADITLDQVLAPVVLNARTRK